MRWAPASLSPRIHARSTPTANRHHYFGTKKTACPDAYLLCCVVLCYVDLRTHHQHTTIDFHKFNNHQMPHQSTLASQLMFHHHHDLRPCAQQLSERVASAAALRLPRHRNAIGRSLRAHVGLDWHSLASCGCGGDGLLKSRDRVTIRISS